MPNIAKLLILVSVCSVARRGFTQSLGDVAREQRQTQQAKSGSSASKVYTNADVGAPPEGNAPKTTADEEPTRENASSQQDAARAKTPAQQWKRAIEGQKNAITSLQKQIDELNSSIRYVEANRYRDGVQHNEHQAEKQAQAQRMQMQLDQQKRYLEQMQEGARREGYGSAIYDP